MMELKRTAILEQQHHSGDFDTGSALSVAFKSQKKFGLLTAAEVEYAAKVVKKFHSDKQLEFSTLDFFEPSAKELVSISLGDCTRVARRMAVVISSSLADKETFVDYVILDGPLIDAAFSEEFKDKNVFDMSVKSAVVQSDVLHGVQPGISPDEYTLVELICQAYDPLHEAIRKRGLDPKHLVADAWCVGHADSGSDPHERICWPALYFFDQSVDHLPYARPIEGIEIRISLTKKAVKSFEDTSFGILPIPTSFETQSHYIPKEQQRQGLKPIVITQPEGPSWTVEDTNTILWQRWRCQLGFNSREGVTLHGITFDDRSVLSRLSVCEMVVPYGDPRSPHCLKNAFDAGEDGLGRNANSLVLGCDCLGLIRYFDANLVRDNGDLFVIKNAICMHEEDCGIAWKHTDWRTGVAQMRRNRRLVFSFICTIANYEYAFYYHLYLDGAIEVEVKLTGVVNTGVLSYEEQEKGGRKYGVNLGGCLYGPVHQHFFVAKMDFAVDGLVNHISELNAVLESEGEHNPSNNAFYYEETILDSEKKAIRDCSPESGRYWKIFNPNKKNAIGQHTAYKLVAESKVLPLAVLSKASYLKRAQFLEHQLWVTPTRPDERYPGGEFPNQCPTVEGLPRWTAQDRSLIGEQLSVWHVFGVTHNPRPEDWPVMPVEHCSFKLKPVGFFTSSPIMDLPESSSSSHGHGCGGTDLAPHQCGFENGTVV